MNIKKLFMFAPFLLILALFAVNKIPVDKSKEVADLERIVRALPENPAYIKAGKILSEVKVDLSSEDREVLHLAFKNRDELDQKSLDRILDENKEVILKVEQAILLGGAQYIKEDSKIESSINLFQEKHAYSLYLSNLMNTRALASIEKLYAFEKFMFNTLNSHSFIVQKLLHVSTLKSIRAQIRKLHPDAVFNKLDYSSLNETAFLGEFMVAKNMFIDATQDKGFLKKTFYNANSSLNYYTYLSTKNKNAECLKKTALSCSDEKAFGLYLRNPIGKYLVSLWQVHPLSYQKLKINIDKVNSI